MNKQTNWNNRLFELVPYENRYLYRFCRKVFHRANGDNDDDLRTNGELALMRRVLPGAVTVFDVGANVGDWTNEALSINEDAEYHLFEPSVTTYERLKGREFPGNVILNNAGLGAEDCDMELFVFGEAMGANSLYGRAGTDAVEQRRERVRIRTLDGYCAEKQIQRIDFLKVDVEGHELEVLKGASGLLKQRRIGLIQFEYGGTYIDSRTLLKDVWDLMRHVDPEKQFYKLHGQGPRHVPRYRQELETFQYSNWALVTRDEIERWPRQ